MEWFQHRFHAATKLRNLKSQLEMIVYSDSINMWNGCLLRLFTEETWKLTKFRICRQVDVSFWFYEMPKLNRYPRSLVINSMNQILPLWKTSCYQEAIWLQQNTWNLKQTFVMPWCVREVRHYNNSECLCEDDIDEKLVLCYKNTTFLKIAELREKWGYRV